MKFLCLKNKIYLDDFNEIFSWVLGDVYYNFKYMKNNIKKRKILLKIRPGLSSNILKNSIKRDKNNNFLEQYININQKQGKKQMFFKNINLAFENVSTILVNEVDELKKYDYYDNINFFFNNNPFYSDLNYIFSNLCFDFKSIFEIKSIKNNKVMMKKSKNNNKYTHEIIYIPPERRLKYVLKSLSIYKENFKNYNLWERCFWSFFMTLVLYDRSFLKKRREFIYFKSVKFFKRKKTSNISSSK